ncbi:hypothetical protein DYU11_20405 [Fibrisoma montanum]|uniref:Uncharacterized protein n=1 Tax=Fibrisoma montanum TaxID=2305895 RepID=A0A418M3R0_9BACT|nr:hypothetical protein [Fibrisoma montanum]RIV20412.1 hypothetical protein DYU11_20405 [Fibrisoma montanum]
MKGRIFLNTGLFPNGHALTKFDWTARLIPGAGLFFDFDIQSEAYCSDYDGNFEDEDHLLWESKGMWANSGACWISSTDEWETGFLVGNSVEPFTFERLGNASYCPDPLEGYWENEDRSFAAYILDHDFVCGHTIEFEKQESGLYAINWTGKVALSNEGDFEFKYNFLVKASEVKFDGVRFPARMTLDEAREELNRYVVNIDEFTVKNYQADTRYFPEPRFVPL